MKRNILTQADLRDIKKYIESGQISEKTVNELGLFLTKSRKHRYHFNYEEHLTNTQIHLLSCIVCSISERRKSNTL